MFNDVVNALRKEHNYEREYGLDYFSDGLDEVEPKPYDDFFSVTTFGSNEGIYTGIYVIREADRKEEKIALAKTLAESEEAYIKMHELGAKVCLELREMTIPGCEKSIVG